MKRMSPMWWREYASTIRALERCGYVVVPNEATAGMAVAGVAFIKKEIMRLMDPDPDSGIDPIIRMAKLYEEMIAKRPTPWRDRP